MLGFCCCGCNQFADDFDLADTSDLGDKWTEVSGDWEIVSNQLVVDSPAYGQIVLDPVSFVYPKSYSIEADLTFFDDYGEETDTHTIGKPGLCLSSNDDGTSWVGVFITPTAIEITEGIIFTKSIPVTLTAGVSYHVKACYHAISGFCQVWLDDEFMGFSLLGHGAGGIRAGLINGADGRATWDNYSHDKARGNVDGPSTSCPYCGICYCCQGDPLPEQIKLTMSGWGSASNTNPCADCGDLNATFYIDGTDLQCGGNTSIEIDCGSGPTRHVNIAWGYSILPNDAVYGGTTDTCSWWVHIQIINSCSGPGFAIGVYDVSFQYAGSGLEQCDLLDDGPLTLSKVYETPESGGSTYCWGCDPPSTITIELP